GAFFSSGTIYGVMVVNMWQVVTIVKDAFSGSGIVIANCLSCTTVGQYAFAFCSYLTTVNLPGATSIGNNCFNADSSLSSVSLVSCTNLGGTVGNNLVFDNIFGSTLTLSV
ncbi:MAG TPA: leucine-rich repeat protein, partial [Paludibacteraceae bacterium]|nr:leucine-rich repeat protein [Paludibacteraceae bacterium]